MTMSADQVEVVIGVDTHKHTAAVVMSATGAAVHELTVSTDPDGYLALLDLAEHHSGTRTSECQCGLTVSMTVSLD